MSTEDVRLHLVKRFREPTDSETLRFQPAL